MREDSSHIMISQMLDIVNKKKLFEVYFIMACTYYVETKLYSEFLFRPFVIYLSSLLASHGKVSWSLI